MYTSCRHIENKTMFDGNGLNFYIPCFAQRQKKMLEVREKHNTSLSSLRLPSTTHYHKDCNLLAHKKQHSITKRQLLWYA